MKNQIKAALFGVAVGAFFVKWMQEGYWVHIINPEWLNTIARKSDIEDLCERLFIQVATKY